MMIFKVSYIIIFPPFITASTEIATLNFFGLTFTPTNIIAFRLIGDGQVELLRYPASREYRLHYHNTIQHVAQNQDRAASALFEETAEYNTTISLYRKAIAPFTHHLHNRLGIEPIYACLFLPSIFDVDVMHAAATAILPAWEEGIETMHGSHHRFALDGYHFLEGKYIGHTPEECDGYCPESLMLLLEYQKEYMYISLKVVDFELNAYPTQAKELCVECGAREREEFGDVKYEQWISELLRTFIDRSLPPYYQLEDIRAIVIAGEASASSVSELGSIALKAVGTDAVKLITAIEPENVVAHGAAIWAQKSHQDPDAWWSCPSRTFLARLAHWRDYAERVGDGIPMYNKLIGAGDVPIHNRMIEAGVGRRTI